MRTSHADVNFLSVSNNIWGLDEGSDHAQTLPGKPDLSILALAPEKARTYDAVLKVFDGTSGQDLAAGVIAQGQENAVDLNNRVVSVHVSGEYGAAGETGDQVITTKGGCSNCSFTGPVRSKGRNAHVVVGAWSDQCFDVSEDLDYSGLQQTQDSGQLTFILSRCRGVKLPAGAKVLRLKSIEYSCYWWGKRGYVAALSLWQGVKPKLATAWQWVRSKLHR